MTKNLNECYEPGKEFKSCNEDGSPKKCSPNDPRFTHNVNTNPLDSKIEQLNDLGQAIKCDPMTTGQIINEPSDEEFPHSTIYRYAKGIRGCDQAVRDLFTDVVVLDTNSKAHSVPIVWGTQERAVAIATQENVRKDNSLVVDRITLPIMSLFTSGHAMNNDRYMYHGALDFYNRLRTDGKPAYFTQENRHPRDTVFGLARGIPIDISYTLTIWTMYLEDMNEILEQIYLKFSGGIAYIRIQGVTNWDPVVRLDSINSNIDTNPGDSAQRVIKFEIALTAEAFIPQPIQRRKAVLKTIIDVVDGLSDEDIQQVITKIENSVEGVE